MNHSSVTASELTPLDQREREIARKIFLNFSGFRPERFPEIRSLLRPSVLLSGDLLLVERSPDNGLRIMMGDFTGHGITAALGSILVTEIFLQLARSGVPMSQIVKEVNDRLYKKLPSGLFCASIFLSLERHGRDLVRIWNCGMPPLLVVRPSGGEIIERIDSSHLPLGIVASQQMNLRSNDLFPKLGDHFFLSSDGLTEAVNQQGEMVGQQQVEEMVATIAGFDTDEVQLDIPRYLAKFIDHHTDGVGQKDDITVMELAILQQDIPTNSGHHDHDTGHDGIGNLVWSYSLELGVDALREDEDPVSTFVQQVVARLRRHITFGSKVQREVFTLLNESWSNALEHGLLGLESTMKETADGFEHYYLMKQERLMSLRKGTVRLECGYRVSGDQQRLLFTVSDSGSGFDHQQWRRQHHDPEPMGQQGEVTAHGRGLSIIQALSDWIRFSDQGSTITMAYRLTDIQSGDQEKKEEDDSFPGYFK